MMRRQEEQMPGMSIAVVLENIHTSTMEVIFLKTPLTPLKISIKNTFH